MWWIFAARAGVFDFDNVPIEGELARPSSGPSVAAPPEDLPRELSALLRRARDQEAMLLRARERGAPTAELQIELDRAYEQLFTAYRAAPAPAAPAALGVWRAQLGFLLQESGRTEEAAEEWRSGLALAPEHPLAAASRVALGDLLFARSELLPAMEHYRSAQTHPESGRYASYKLAWCLYNLGESEDAVDALLGAIREERDTLAREARQDLARFLVSSPPDEARSIIVRACAGQEGCLEELSAALALARADAGLAP